MALPWPQMLYQQEARVFSWYLPHPPYSEVGGAVKKRPHMVKYCVEVLWQGWQGGGIHIRKLSSAYAAYCWVGLGCHTVPKL